jgi:hypothetical protein
MNVSNLLPVALNISGRSTTTTVTTSYGRRGFWGFGRVNEPDTAEFGELLWSVLEELE